MTRLVVVVVLALASAACAAPAPDTAAFREGNYIATRVVEGGFQMSFIPGTEIRLELERGFFHATAGCNRMSGPYAVTSAGVFNVAENSGMTIVGCAPGGWEQDVWLQGFIKARPVVIASETGLILDDGYTRIEFTRR